MARTRFWAFLCVAIVTFGLAACGQPAAATPTSAPAAKPTSAAPASSPTVAKPAAGAASPTAASPAKPAASPSPAAVKPLSPPVAIKVGILGATADVGIFIAQERGYFKEEGLDVEPITIVSGADVIPPLATGEWQFGSGSINPGFFNAAARGIDIKIVADKSKVDPQLAGGGLITRKDADESGQIKELSQLKGKTIAINQKATTSEMYVDKILEKAGLSLADVNLVEMPFPDMLAALANKSIDVAWTIEPFIAIGTQRGISSMIFPMWDVYPNHFTNVMMISPVFAKEQPEAAKRFITAHLRGQRDYYDAYIKKTAPLDPIIDILTKNTTIKDAATFKLLRMGSVDPNGYIHAEFLANDQDYYFKKGYVKDKVDTTKLVDFQYVEYALQRLGRIN